MLQFFLNEDVAIFIKYELFIKFPIYSNDDAADFPTLSLLAGLSLDTAREPVHRRSLGHSNKKIPKPKV